MQLSHKYLQFYTILNTTSKHQPFLLFKSSTTSPLNGITCTFPAHMEKKPCNVTKRNMNLIVLKEKAFVRNFLILNFTLVHNPKVKNKTRNHYHLKMWKIKAVKICNVTNHVTLLTIDYPMQLSHKYIQFYTILNTAS